jgi:hypothetical protein
MKNNIFWKYLIICINALFVTASVIPSMGGNFEKIDNKSVDNESRVASVLDYPDWLWAKRAGGTGDDSYVRESISVDSDGNMYISGVFEGMATFGTITLNTDYGNFDIFVAKMDNDGNWLWAKQAGGTYWDYPMGISVDTDGNVYVTGEIHTVATFGTIILTTYGSSDAFVAKLDSYGNWLWAENAGGNSDDKGNSITVDNDGFVYVTGCFHSDSMRFGTIILDCSGYYDIFVAKMDNDGNWIWAKQAGGTDFESPHDIYVDADGNAYITGYICDEATFGTTTLIPFGEWDVFVTKLDTNGNWQWAKNAGGTGLVVGNSISVDTNGKVYATGHFNGMPTFETTVLTTLGDWDIFVAKMDTDGTWLWAEQAGGSSVDDGNSICVDLNGSIYITGSFAGTTSFGSIVLTTTGVYDSDVYVAKIDNDSNWIWAKQAGGNHYATSHEIVIDSYGNCYITGYFNDKVFFGNVILESSGEKDVFVAKLSQTGGSPDIFVESIIGGLGIKATIRNNGTENATGIPWSIEVSDGWFFLRGKELSGTVDILSNDTKEVSNKRLVGFGRNVLITVTAGDSLLIGTAKWVIGPLVWGLTIYY